MRMKINHYLVKSFYVLIDLVVLSLAVYLACFIREGKVPFDVTLHSVLFGEANPFRFLFAFWIISTIYCANANRLYQTRREVLEWIEILLVIKSVMIASLVLIVALYLLKVEGFPRSIMIIGVCLMTAFMSLWRIAKRIFVDYLVAHGYNNFNVLIIGAGRVGVALAREIQNRPTMGLRIIGFLDDFKENSPEESDLPRVIGRINEFEYIAQRRFINQVFITIHHDSRVFFQILQQARSLGISVRVIPQGFDMIPGSIDRYNIGFIPVLDYSGLANIRRQVGKRLLDCVASLLALLMLWPLFVVICILIKLDSPGPVFFQSLRYGRRGRKFYMLKFRSMVRDAEQRLADIRDKNEAGGPIFKIRSDPRVTKIGRFLRRYSLDELPQLINVLKGEMSLVGPRPFPVDQIEQHDLRQYKRLEVRPGITGLWQIRGRSDVSFFRLIKWDMWYINNWSFWLDLYVLVRTIPVVLKAKGAY